MALRYPLRLSSNVQRKKSTCTVGYMFLPWKNVNPSEHGRFRLRLRDAPEKLAERKGYPVCIQSSAGEKRRRIERNDSRKTHPLEGG